MCSVLEKRAQREGEKAKEVEKGSKVCESVVFLMKNISSSGDLHDAKMFFRCSLQSTLRVERNLVLGPGESLRKNQLGGGGSFLATGEKLFSKPEPSLNLQ
jgi:hypothetical protein